MVSRSSTRSGDGRRRVGVALAIAAATGIVAWVGAQGPLRFAGCAAWSPALGLLLALLLLRGRARFLETAAAGALGMLAADLALGASSAAAACDALIVALQAALAAGALARLVPEGLRLQRLREAVGLVAIGTLLGAASGAPLWSAAARLVPTAGSGPLLVRFLADTVGILVVAPFVLAAADAAPRPERRWPVARWAEAALLYGGIVALALLLFVRPEPWSGLGARRYMAFPLLLWAAIRFGSAGAALASATLVLVLVPFSLPEITGFDADPRSPREQFMALQLYLAVAGATTVLLGTVVAERAEVHRAARESEARFRAQIEHAPDAIVVLDVDTGRFVDHNPAAERLFGLSASELARLGPVDLSPPTQPDGRRSEEGVRQRIEEALAGGTPTFEWTHRASDGRELACEVRLLRLPSSRRRLVRGSITEISERKRAVGALQRSEANLRVAQRVGGVGSWRVDVAKSTLEWSEECFRIFGRDPATFQPSNEAFFACVHPDDRAAVEAASRRSLESGAPYRIEHRILRPDGSVRHILEHAEIERDASGRVVVMVGTSQDVTERRLLQLQLLQSQKLESVGRLAGGIAHDFNNLLTVIRGEADLMLAQRPAGDPVHASALEISMAAERANGLTRQLLAFARRQIVAPKVLDLRELAADMEKLLRRVLGEDVEFTLRAAPDVGRVKADRGQLEQVLMNLAVNARDAMPGGGRLSVAIDDVVLEDEAHGGPPGAQPGSWVRLVVADSGSGMDPQTLAHVFEPFFTTKEVGKGTGLGLATVHGIVTQAGGHVSVQSERGKGSAFTILLPRTDDRPAAAAASGDRAALARGSATILLVEDDAQLRRIVTRVLLSCGYAVVDVAGGDEAWAAATGAARAFDLLITDMVLPRTSGRDVAARLRGRWPTLRVLCISGYTEDESFRRDVLLGDCAWLPKPFTPAALAAKVRELLETRARVP